MKALTIKLEDYILPAQLQEFLSYLRSEKSLSDGTISRYILNLKHLCQQSGRPLLEINKYADLSSYIRGIRERCGWSASSTKNAADTCSVFYTWAARFQLIDHNNNPMILGHEFDNKNRRQMDFFEWSDGDFQKLMYHPNNSVRDNAILQTLRSSGVRASALCNLTFNDVDMENCWFRLRNGKGGKDTYVNFDPENRDYIAKYHEKMKLFSRLPWAFQTEDFQKLKPQTLYKMVRRKCEKLGMAGCPQKFRRSLGGEMIANGADLSDVQHQLGHDSPQTTARHYVFHKSKRQKERYDKGVPRFGLQVPA